MQLQQGNQQQAASQQIGALHQEITGLKQSLQQLHTEHQLGHVRSEIDQFAVEHPRFDELGEVIKKELELGFDLATAYQRAELLHPATQAAQTRTTPAQTRELTDHDIHGRSDVGSRQTERRAVGEGSQSDPSRLPS